MLAYRHFAASECLGDLTIRELLHEPHQHCLGLFSRQAADGLEDLLAFFPSRDPFGRRRRRIRQCLGKRFEFFTVLMSGSLADDPISRIDADSQDQGVWVGMPADAVQALPDRRQRFLEGVIGIVGVSDDSPYGSNHSVFDRTNEPLVIAVTAVQSLLSSLFSVRGRISRHFLPAFIFINAYKGSFVDKPYKKYAFPPCTI